MARGGKRLSRPGKMGGGYMAEGTVIIKRVKKGGHAAHHGGAWKVAYADFVTAMMAFFLLMWLINTTSPQQKRGIADYFAPASVSETTSGSGGILGGTALGQDGAQSKGSSSGIQELSPDSRHPDDGKTTGGAKAESDWTLSAARANASRKILQDAGVDPDRIYQVSGKATSEPLYPDDPGLPGNRRIAIVLLREAPVLPPSPAL